MPNSEFGPLVRYRGGPGETSLCPGTVWQLLRWQLPSEPSSEKVHVGITHTHTGSGPGQMMSIVRSPGLSAAVLLGTPGMLPAVLAAGSHPHHSWQRSPARLFVICWGALPSFPLLPPPPPQVHWFSSQLNEALNRGIIQL